MEQKRLNDMNLAVHTCFGTQITGFVKFRSLNGHSVELCDALQSSMGQYV